MNARCRPWTFEWTLKPSAIMVSAIDFFKSPRIFEKVKKYGIHEFLEWDGKIICDSGAFSALNRKKKVDLDIERLKEIYIELTNQDPSIIKITLDFPDNKIIENYIDLYPLEVQPVVPYDRTELLNDIITCMGPPEWLFIGRLVPLMRKGGNPAARLFPVLDGIKNQLVGICESQTTKLWALGVGAPSLITRLHDKIEGCDSSRWRITGSNMILLPQGGERGVGNRTKWRGTHNRIDAGSEKLVITEILSQIDAKSGGLECLDHSLNPELYPRSIKDKREEKLPKIGTILNRLRDEKNHVSVYELELLLRTSGNLRLIFNYWSALSFKLSVKDTIKLR
jgi:hypothetical protein